MPSRWSRFGWAAMPTRPVCECRVNDWEKGWLLRVWSHERRREARCTGGGVAGCASVVGRWRLAKVVGGWQSLPARHAGSLSSFLVVVGMVQEQLRDVHKHGNSLFSYHLREKNVGHSLFHVALVHRRPACRRQFLDLAESHRAAPHYYGPGDL
jgi:hypothetical protein